MTFQSSVELQQGFGVIGELYSNSPVRSSTYVLDSGVDNIIGRAFTLNTGANEAGFTSSTAQMGGTGTYAGIFANPKAQASFGVAGNTLAPTLIVADGEIGEMVTMGQIIVKLENTANIGDTVYFAEADGTLVSVAAGGSQPANTQPAYARVIGFTVGSDELAVIEVTQTPEIA